jgi:hypothetical protein
VLTSIVRAMFPLGSCFNLDGYYQLMCTVVFSLSLSYAHLLCVLAHSLSSTNLTQKSVVSPLRSSKRHRSPSISLAVERSSQKRRRQREQRQKSAASVSSSIKIDDDIEQENDDDDITANKHDKPKQRQASSGSIEYVQTLNDDPYAPSSLNNIENLNSQSKHDDDDDDEDNDDVILCQSPIPTATTTKKQMASKSERLVKVNQHEVRHRTVVNRFRLVRTIYVDDCVVFCRQRTPMNMCAFVVKFAATFSKDAVVFPSMFSQCIRIY